MNLANPVLIKIKHFWHKRNGHSFTAACPECLKRIRLECGYDLTRAATGLVRLDGWSGRCPDCRKRYDALSIDIDKAVKAGKNEQARLVRY